MAYRDGKIFGNMNRYQGQYDCSTYVRAEKMSGCTLKFFSQLLKEDIASFDKLINAEQRKSILNSAIIDYTSARNRFMMDFNNRSHQLPTNCQEIIDIMRQTDYENRIEDVQECQVKFTNGSALAISKDGSHVTVYDDIYDPKYYMANKAVEKFDGNGLLEFYGTEEADQVIQAKAFVEDFSIYEPFTDELLEKK